MKKSLLFMVIFASLLFSSSDTNKIQRQKALEKQMNKEKKYAKEQVFYQAQNYDLKGAEVDPESVKNIQSIEVQDDFDMDSVYD